MISTASICNDILLESNIQFFEHSNDPLMPKDPAWPDNFGKALHTWFYGSAHRPIRTLSLFSGIGGLDIGFHDVGFQVVEVVEINSACISTISNNLRYFGKDNDVKLIPADIKEYYPDKSLDIDFIIGGPPCQSFSAAGRRMNGVSGLDVESGKLFEHYVRILQTLRPNGFVFENVTGLLGAQKGNAWKEIKTAFSGAGYKTFTRVLDAADYGVPQHRERVLIVGLRDDIVDNFLFPAPTHSHSQIIGRPYYSAGLAVKGLELEGESIVWTSGKYGHLLKDIPPGLNYSFYTAKMGHPRPVFSWRSKFSDFLYKADPNVPTRTIKASGGHFTGPFHWNNRPFSVGELKRIQTIPDEYNMTSIRGTALRQIGNAVPPQMGRVLALAILDQVYNIIAPVRLNYLDNDDKGLQLNRRKQAKTMIYSQKAEVGIRDLPIELKSDLKASRFTRFLHDNFDWNNKPDEKSAKIHIRCNPKNNKWSIRVGRGFIESRKIVYRIFINPARNDKSWEIDVQSIELRATDGSIQTFIACWKVFEELLNERYKLADLVQLSGYYQYASTFSISIKPCRGITTTHNFNVLRCVLAGKGVAFILSVNELALCWGVDLSLIPIYVSFLRELGYEVRSHNTNNQIPINFYLIPYPFPTLKPKSVQLFKNVHSNNQSKTIEESLSEYKLIVNVD